MLFSWLNRTILALGVVSFFSDFGSEMATALLPAFLASLGFLPVFLGVMEGVANAANSLVSIAAGWASDYTQKRKPFAVLGYFLAGLGIGCLAMAKGHFMALFGRILTRVGKGVREPARDVLLTGVTRPQFYGKMFGFHRMMDNLGAVLGPLMGLLLIKFFTINNVFLVAALPVFGAVFIIILFIKEPNVIHEKKQIGFKRNKLVQLSSSFKQYCWAVGVFGLGNCAASLLVLRSIEMLNPLIGSGSAQWYSIMLYALLNFFYAFFSYPMGVLADTFGKKKILFIGYVLMSIGLWGFMYSIHSFWHLILFFLIVGVAYAIVDAVQRAIAADLLPYTIRGTGFGILAAIMGFGNLVSNIVVGSLWSYASPAAGFGYALIMCLLGAILLSFVKYNASHA